MRTLSLNGYWDWHLPHGPTITRRVPSCYTCVGQAVFERDVELDLAEHERAFLCFEGIHYTGTVSLNGAPLGEMLPYVPYRFEVTDRLAGRKNHLVVTVNDITAEYGPTGGWEDYGGISRDVSIEVHDRILVEDLQWLTTLTPGSEGHPGAHCTLTAWCSSSGVRPSGATLRVTLSRSGAVAHQESRTLDLVGPATATFSFDLPHPDLWSPDAPNLYELRVSLAAGRLQDERRLSVGIRELRVDGSRFLLNGKEIFLKGVARHEMWGDAGFSLTEEQIEEDLGLIKRMGANFVRLVHYPHSRKTVEAADRIGLHLSEEPGLWWSDMADPVITGRALEIVRRTVLRDRNSPSVAAWLFFNECVLKDARDYLVNGRDLCRGLDPSRLISGANCMDSQEARTVFDECGFDFYTQHPYSYEPEALVRAMEVLRGKPLVFTEWGGWYIHNNPNLLRWFKRTIARAAHPAPGQPSLAGLCWWQWQDIFELHRGLPGCMDGVLSDGLVDRYRTRKPMYATMAEIFDLIDRPYDPGWTVEHVGAGCAAVEHASDGHRVRDARSALIDLSPIVSSPSQQAAWEYALSSVRKLEKSPQRKGVRNTGALLPVDVVSPAGLPVVVKAGRPIILAGDCREVEVPIGRRTALLHLLGHTTYYDGFPVRGQGGAVVARYVLLFEDGTTTEVPLRNGMELASASMLARHSRMNPIATEAPRVLRITIDPDWEIYQVNCYRLPLDGRKVLARLRFESLSRDFHPLLYAVVAEDA
ncbi:MAG TPA: glycoside hydrolase family 2 TIM barrel-domain containing protein [Spirochaetia bacterium]|nr:glycoside hydrolase family 2 TIM barrel-domain containing protein [Spirochaetia bacterium]